MSLSIANHALYLSDTVLCSNWKKSNICTVPFLSTQDMLSVLSLLFNKHVMFIILLILLILTAAQWKISNVHVIFLCCFSSISEAFQWRTQAFRNVMKYKIAFRCVKWHNGCSVFLLTESVIFFSSLPPTNIICRWCISLEHAQVLLPILLTDTHLCAITCRNVTVQLRQGYST